MFGKFRLKKSLMRFIIKSILLYPLQAGSVETALEKLLPPHWTQNLPWKTIEKKADKYNLDRFLVAAIIQTESSGNRCDTRFEKRFKHLYHPEKFAQLNQITVQAEIEHQKTSFGLMQIMGSVARELGFKRNLWNLCNPRMNVELGVKKLKKLSGRHESMEDLIASYNAGRPFMLSNGKYKNHQYVNKVLQRYQEIVRGVAVTLPSTITLAANN